MNQFSLVQTAAPPLPCHGLAGTEQGMFNSAVRTVQEGSNPAQ